ncbi:ABC transporter transmembrane domain-containing protein [Spirochaeta isovalerica]|uniref:ATP-binding cassette subfamily B protein n=1 Tax=Spirochaeta isovalerica TaxID=150 RepID=A0A841R911_9SPIO|nr:ATP-binding cassette subfamily B protein [Spirochaeta isovalerica]
MAESHFKEESFSNKLSFKTAARIVRQATPHWPLLIGFILFIMVTAFIEAFNTYIVKNAIDLAVIPGDGPMLLRFMMIYGSLHIVLAGTVFGFIYCAGRLGEQIQYDLRKKLFNHLQDLSFSYFDKTPVGWIISRCTSDIQRVSDLVTWNLLDLVWAITNIISAMVFMFLINWKLALIVVVAMPILISIALRFQKYIIGEFRKVRSINSKITGAYNENITGVKIIKALVREKKNLSLFGQLTDNMYNASYRAVWLSAIFLPIVQLLTAVAFGAVLWFGGFQFKLGLFTIGGIQAFISYITFMMWPVQDLARVYGEMQQAVASAERVFSLIDTEPDIQDTPDSYDVESVKGEIEFRNVDFYYEENNPVLSDFSLTVKPGETIALVGPTGGGKSTIVNLICRFYEPKKGRILMGGRDYRSFTQQSLQSKLGVVLQTPHLFSGTIMDNIRYGRLEASDEEVIEAAKLAHAHDFIAELDKQYYEDVGEEGTLLSVGQKQLISLARAILAKPEIIIMDEATSSIDTLTEELIQKGMDTLLDGSTGFVIAHRLSTIRNADRILVIESGKIKEMGSHRELLAKRGHYFDLYTRQFRRERQRDLHVFS